jgi:transposase-like protein
MTECPRCHATVPQVKAGTPSAGSQRYRCTACCYKDTPTPTARGDPAELRQRVVQESVDGRNVRQSARQCGLVHQTVATWIAAHSDALPDHPALPTRGETAERDELDTCVGAKKTPVPSSQRSIGPRAV